MTALNHADTDTSRDSFSDASTIFAPSRPALERSNRQVHVVVPGVIGDLLTKAVWTRHSLVLGSELDFGDDQACIGPQELVDFSHQAAVRDAAPDLVDAGVDAQREQLPRIGKRDRVLELLAGDADRWSLDRPKRCIALDAYANAESPLLL